MTYRRFKWLSGCIVAGIVVVTIAGMLIFSHHSRPASSRKQDKIGEYVYIDRLGILHANRKCSRLNYKGMTSYRLRVSEGYSHDRELICPKCVSDEMYEALP